MLFQQIRDTLNGTTRRRFRTQVALGTTIGFIVGAAAGILLAPKSGAKTREDIKTAATKSADRVNEAAHQTVVLTRKEAAALKEKFKDMKNYWKRSSKCRQATEDYFEDNETVRDTH